MTTLIEVSGLRKLYSSSFRKPKITALDGIDFQVQEGEMFGLLGPNGAGKTTTVKILLGLTHATSGNAFVSGLPVSNPESRRRVGYLPEGHKIPNYLTARQALSIFGRMSGMKTAAIQKRVPELLERVRLTQWIDVRVKKFSKGMTQRLGLACALIHSPNVLLLDEPTDGVDPVGRSEMRGTLQRLKSEGKTIFINSHLLQEIELVCDRVAILVHGEVRREGLVEEITRPQQTEIELTVLGSEVAIREALGFQQIASMKPLGENRFHIVLHIPDQSAVDQTIDGLRTGGISIEELARRRDTLEEAFLGIVAQPS